MNNITDDILAHYPRLYVYLYINGERVAIERLQAGQTIEEFNRAIEIEASTYTNVTSQKWLYIDGRSGEVLRVKEVRK